MTESNLSKEARVDAILKLRDEQKQDEALSAAESLVADYPEYPLAHLTLAVFLDRAKIYDRALAEAGEACRLNPEDPFYYTALSSLAIRSGRHAEAEEALMKAQEARFAAQLKKMRDESEKEKTAEKTDEKPADAE